jgi:Flp pilus assembly protein TadD
MKYRCIPCNHEFEAPKGTKPRCPRCLKIHDVEPIESPGLPKKTSAKTILVPIAVLIVAIIVGIVYVLTKNDSTGETKESAVDSKSVFETAGIPKEEAQDPCAPGKYVEKLASKLAGGKSGDAAMDALFTGLEELKGETGWLPYHQREPRETRPLRAEQLAKQLTGNTADGAPFRAMSYELACLLLASARALDIADAKMVQIHAFKGEKHPADTAGKLGRYGVALNVDPKAIDAVQVYDLFGGRSKSGATASVTILDDSGAMAPYFGIGALSLLVKQEMSKALSLNDIAIKLNDQNPYFRSNRGLIFAATGVPTEALVEFEKALKLRNDPVQRINLAELLMLINPMDKRAETEVQLALKDAPDYARAHALKGMIHLIRQETDQAETELTLAERLDPKSPSIAMYWARYYSVRMNSEEAIAKAKQAVTLSGNSVSMLLGLASIYREVARFDDMRSTLDKVYEKVKTPQMADQIKQAFDYDLSPDDAELSDTEGATAGADDNTPSNYKLKLGEGFGGGNLGGSKTGPGLGGNLNLDLNIK